MREILENIIWLCLIGFGLGGASLIWHAYAGGKEKDPDDRALRERWLETSYKWMITLYLVALPLIVILLCLPEQVGAEAMESAPVVQEIPEVRLGESPLPVPEKAHRVGAGRVTFYCCEKRPHICGGGRTATGKPVVPGETCAVDPEVIPLGATVAVWYEQGDLLVYRAEDVGGAVKGNHIDVAVSRHEHALELGEMRAKEIWWWNE